MTALPLSIRSRIARFCRAHPIIALFFILLALMLALRLTWGWVVDRGLQAQYAAFRARDEPIEMQDLHWTPLPDEENAWRLQSQAAEMDNHADAAKVLEKVILGPHVSTGFLQTARSASDMIPCYSHWFALDVHFNRTFETQFKQIAGRRMATVSLATRLYRRDHGRWPEELSQLVPDYLPQVPTDPFHADGRPLGYFLQRGALPDGSDRPSFTSIPARSKTS